MTKAEARKHFREQRRLLSKEAYQLANQQIYKHLMPWLKELKPLTVHCFLPIHKNREVNTWPLIGELQSENIGVVVSRTNVKQNSMEHFILKEGTACPENVWGIPEPEGESLVRVTEEEIALVLVPLLAFDLQGQRVGYGKGYYDLFLSKCLPNTLKVGLSLFEPIEKIKDIYPHDIGLTHAVSPNKLWDFKHSQC